MSSKNEYALIQKILHWIVALAVISSIAMGVWMVNIGWEGVSKEAAATRDWLYSNHKSLGFVILALMILRLIARAIYRAPAPDESLPLAQRRAAEAAHLLLYVLLFAAPLLGWAATSAGRYMEPVFGLFSMPELIAQKDGALARSLFDIHSIAGLAIGVVAGIHIIAALWHRFVRRDEVMKRMWF